MLITLLKHDVKAMGRLLAPVILALLAISAVLGFNIRTQFSSAILAKISAILFVLLIGLISVAFFLTFIMTIVRFRQNLLGNQGYLSFALPVSTAEHIISKFLSSLLWTILSILAAVASFYLIYTLGIPVFQRKVGETLIERFFAELDFDFLTPENLLVVLSTVTESIFHLYVSIAVGHLWQKHSVIGAVLAYVGLSILRSQIYFHFLSGFIVENHFSIYSIWFAFGFSLLYAAGTWLILERSLNLE